MSVLVLARGVTVRASWISQMTTYPGKVNNVYSFGQVFLVCRFSCNVGPNHPVQNNGPIPRPSIKGGPAALPSDSRNSKRIPSGPRSLTPLVPVLAVTRRKKGLLRPSYFYQALLAYTSKANCPLLSCCLDIFILFWCNLSKFDDHYGATRVGNGHQARKGRNRCKRSDQIC
jgi:hypothetical protein